MKRWWRLVIVSSMATACTTDADLGGGTSTDGLDGNAPVSDASGPSDAAQSEHGCLESFSNIGTADFRISFTITTTQGGAAALVNQRRTCVHGVFWDLRMYDGIIQVEVDDIANYTSLRTDGAPVVNDGRPHAVLVWRASAALFGSVDGVVSGPSA